MKPQMNTARHSRNQTKVLRVFFACFAPSRWKSSPGFTAKPWRAPRARRFREEKSFATRRGFFGQMANDQWQI